MNEYASSPQSIANRIWEKFGIDGEPPKVFASFESYRDSNDYMPGSKMHRFAGMQKRFTRDGREIECIMGPIVVNDDIRSWNGLSYDKMMEAVLEHEMAHMVTGLNEPAYFIANEVFANQKVPMYLNDFTWELDETVAWVPPAAINGKSVMEAVKSNVLRITAGGKDRGKIIDQSVEIAEKVGLDILKHPTKALDHDVFRHWRGERFHEYRDSFLRLHEWTKENVEAVVSYQGVSQRVFM